MDKRITEVEVFKTSIGSPAEASRVMSQLLLSHPYLKINIDLEDCDKVLRIESVDIVPREEILETVRRAGYFIQILE